MLSGRKPLYRRSLAIREKALGAEHPDVAWTLNDMAALYHDQGRYTEAEPLYKRSHAINDKALGPEHREVAIALHNLAELYQDQAATPRRTTGKERRITRWGERACA